MTIRTNYRPTAHAAATPSIEEICKARAGKLVAWGDKHYRVTTGHVHSTGYITVTDVAGKRRFIRAALVAALPVVYERK